MTEDPKSSAPSVPQGQVQERSDMILGRVLGGNLMGATVRIAGLIAGAGVVLATIAALAG